MSHQTMTFTNTQSNPPRAKPGGTREVYVDYLGGQRFPKVPRYVSRVDSEGWHGWQVRWPAPRGPIRRGQGSTPRKFESRFFSDAAFAGDADKAFKAACKFVKGLEIAPPKLVLDPKVGVTDYVKQRPNSAGTLYVQCSMPDGKPPVRTYICKVDERDQPENAKKYAAALRAAWKLRRETVAEYNARNKT